MSIKGALHLQKSHANILCTPWFPKVFHLFETKNKRTIEMKVLMAGDFLFGLRQPGGIFVRLQIQYK